MHGSWLGTGCDAEESNESCMTENIQEAMTKASIGTSITYRSGYTIKRKRSPNPERGIKTLQGGLTKRYQNPS